MHPIAFAELWDLNTLTVIASDAPITYLALVASLATYNTLISHTCDYTYARTWAASVTYGSACATYGTACTTYRSACATYGSAFAFTASHATTTHPILARMATLKKIFKMIS